MNPLHITIFLAIAGGLGIIAYRTPLIFQKLYWPLSGILCISQLVLFVWNLGRSQAHENLLPFISPDKMQQANQVYKLTGIDSTTYLIALVFILYSGFLYWLTTEVIKHGYDKKPEQKL